MNWANTLYIKLVLGLVATLLIVALLATLSVSLLTQQFRATANQKLNQNLAQNLVDDKRIVRDGKIDIDVLKQTFMEYMSINPDIEIYYLDLQGKIRSYSAEPGKVKRNSVGIEPIKAFLSGSTQLPLLGDDPRSHHRQKAFSVTVIPNAKQPEGYLYVVLQGEEFTAAQQAQSSYQLLSLATPGLIASLVSGLLIGLFIFRRLTLRLKTLQEKVTLFTQNDFRQPSLFDHAEQGGGDEIVELENRFHQMGEHIAEQWSALVQQDQLRREMIANISHDLRTPLAAIQGYLETIVLKGNRLSNDQRQRYFDIALTQSNRLQNLIDQLFELAKLETTDTHVSFERFSILELVYDVVNKFSLKAENHQVHLSVDKQAIDAQVVADIGLIERVLDNLLDNALRYTPAEKAIRLDVQIGDNGQICVSVIDEGKGISTQHKSLIFDRFHRVDNPQRSSSGHAGLGLAIVKKIVELHQQRVWVESELGKGSKFSFTLSVAA